MPKRSLCSRQNHLQFAFHPSRSPKCSRVGGTVILNHFILLLQLTTPCSILWPQVVEGVSSSNVLDLIQKCASLHCCNVHCTLCKLELSSFLLVFQSSIFNDLCLKCLRIDIQYLMTSSLSNNYLLNNVILFKLWLKSLKPIKL